MTAEGEITFAHQNMLGSTVFQSNKSGEVVANYDYDLFGNVNAVEGFKSNMLYTGQEFDPENMLHYYNARYYDSETGRFISKDPVAGYSGDLLSRNPYIYVSNNPLMYTDPSGREEAGMMYVNIPEPPTYQVASWYEDGFNNFKKGVSQTWEGVKYGADQVWQGTKYVGNKIGEGASYINQSYIQPVVKPVVDFSAGTVYSIVDNYTYGATSRVTSPPKSNAGQIGQKFGDQLTYVTTAVEIATGYVIGTTGTIGTGAGLATCPATFGGGCAVAGVSAGTAAIGAGIVGHGGSVSLYNATKGSSGGGNIGKEVEKKLKEGQKKVDKKQAPKEIRRIDKPKPPNSPQWHAHDISRKNAINRDGSVRHGNANWVTNKVKKFLNKYGFDL